MKNIYINDLTVKNRVNQTQDETLETEHKVLSLNPILPLEEVMELLNVTRRTLDNWHNQRILEKHWAGKKVFYSAHDILSIINPKTA